MWFFEAYLILLDDIENQSSPLAPSASDMDSFAMACFSNWYSMIWGRLYLERSLAYYLYHFIRSHIEHPKIKADLQM